MTEAMDISASPAAERILEVATDLFYRQGYRATGINEVIEKSGVAKATFYRHFPSKDRLCLAYLQGLRSQEMRDLEAFINKKTTPRDRFMAPIEMMKPWIRAHGFRGCGFVNMVPEVPDPTSPLRKEGMALYDKLRSRVRDLADNLIASDAKLYGHLEADVVADAYLAAFVGALSLAAIYHDIWPVKQAVKTIERLID